MQFQQLKNFGRMYTAKASPRVMLASLTSLPRELGIIGTPRFVAKLQSRDRFWKKRRFVTAEERGLRHQEFIEGIRYSLAFYTALIDTAGKKRAVGLYGKMMDRMGRMMYEDFLPSPESFLSCQDPWEALRGYFLEFFRSYEREGGMRIEVLRDTDTELKIHITDCCWEFMWREAGYPELAPMAGQIDMAFFPHLTRAVGCDFHRESCLCAGAAACDWHFHRGGFLP